MKKLLLPVVVVAVAFFTACGGGGSNSNNGGNNPTLQSISISPSNPTLSLGATQQFTATGHYSDGTTQNLTASATWSPASSFSTRTAGLYTASGTTSSTVTVSASSGGVTGSTTVTLTPATLISITVAPSAATIYAGQTQLFTATGNYSDGSTQNLTNTATWKSSNQSVATIASNGTATGVGVGSASITATSGSITSGAASLTVNAAAIVSIVVTPPTARTAVGFTVQFTATATLTDGTTQNITQAPGTTWSSSNASVATVSNSAGTNGLATGVAPGTTHISASSSNGVGGVNVTGSAAALTVTSARLVSIALTPLAPTISIGTTQQFTATGHFNDGTTQDLTNSASWASSNLNVATVTSHSGFATGVGLGTTNITAAQAGVTSPADVLTVNAAGVLSIAITPNPAQMAIGTSLRFKAVATLNNGSTLDVTTQSTWSIPQSQQSIATIGPHTGIAKASSTNSGAVTVTATLGSVSQNQPLTVTNATVTSITLTPVNDTVPINTRVGYSAVATFSDGTTQGLNTGDVSWSSSNTGVATINQSGVATAVAAGSTTITATFLAYTAPTGSTTLNVSTATLVSIAVTPLQFLIAPGSTATYTAIGTYSDQSTQNITGSVGWSSSNPSVATIGASGIAVGVGQGSTNITATQGSVTSSPPANLVVEGTPLVSIAIAPTSITIPQQIRTPFTATGTFADGNTQNLTQFVTWSSSDTSVATVSNAQNSQGQATSGSTPGTTTITAVYSGVSPATATLTVSTATIQSIAINPPNATISVGQTQQFRAIATFTDSSTLDITNQANWTSSNASQAVVINGLATGTGTGTPSISATLNGVSGSAILTVQ